MKKIATIMMLAVLAVPPVFSADEKPAAAPSVKAASSIPPGYRATSIPVSGDQLLFVKEGDRVDILVTFEAVMKDRKEMVTATILQNVVVLKVHTQGNPDGTGVLQLLLNPNEAQYAMLSVSQGKKISVTVRDPGDTELHPMEIATFRKLIR